MIEEAVRRVLTDPRLSRVTFACGPTLVSAAEYAVVAHYVEQRRIRVVAHPELPAGLAFYGQMTTRLGAPDTFYLSRSIALGAPSASPASMQGTALVLHEATHALQDLRNMGALTKVQAEAAAYVAQSVFYRLYDKSFREHSLMLRRQRGMAQDRADAGNRLLDAVEPVSRGIVEERWTSVPEERLRPIEAAVRNHPTYQVDPDQSVGMNGIAPHHAP